MILTLNVAFPKIVELLDFYKPGRGDRLRIYGELETPHGMILNDTVLFWSRPMDAPINLLDLE